MVEKRRHISCLRFTVLSIAFWGTPEQQHGKEGEDLTVTCNVRSDPTAIISWYVNGTLILDSSRYTMSDDGLHIRSLRPSDYGKYTCRAFVVTPHSSQMKDKDITLYVQCTVCFGHPSIVQV
nr:fasciclin-2-like [Parasteatoda tepidariorum]